MRFPTSEREADRAARCGKKGNVMEKTHFYEFVNRMILPLFTGSYVAGEIESSSRDLEVALGKGNSVLLKPTKSDEYRVILKRGQPFKSFEVNLFLCV